MKKIGMGSAILLFLLSLPAKANGIQIASGWEHTCALRAGQVQCWGGSDWGQLNIPSGMGEVVQIVAGADETCALNSLGEAFCWGTFSSPPDLGKVIALWEGLGTRCALTSGGIRCWGGLAIDEPSDVHFTGVIEKVQTGWMHYCGLEHGGKLRCWDNMGHPAWVPARLGKVSSFSLGLGHTCAVTRIGVKCWNVEKPLLPVPRGLRSAIRISGNYEPKCAILKNGKLMCWDPDGGSYSEGLEVPADLGKVSDVSPGFAHICAVVQDGVRCWGSNKKGQLNVPESLKPQ